MKLKPRLRIALPIAALLSGSLVLAVDRHVTRSTRSQILGMSQLPSNAVGLLLGTSKTLKSGEPNLFFEYRIQAALALYQAGKVRHLVVSGDNGRVGYNEPQDMKDELVRRGVPSERITLDYAGFRTFDSVHRLWSVFGQRRFTIISQRFHEERSLYIANALGLDAVACPARDVDAYNGFKTRVRESFARVKLLLDLAVGRKPRFLGPKITIDPATLSLRSDVPRNGNLG